MQDSQSYTNPVSKKWKGEKKTTVAPVRSWVVTSYPHTTERTNVKWDVYSKAPPRGSTTFPNSTNNWEKIFTYRDKEVNSTRHI